MNRTRRFGLTLLLGLALAMFGAAPAFAHGETSQEPWLRMNTVAFWDTTFSAGGETKEPVGIFPAGQSNFGKEDALVVDKGAEISVTGTARVLETWPRTLRGPDTAFVSIVSPGPRVILTERYINELPAPHSVYIQKGGTYNYRMTVVGRIPGEYHLHPTFAVRGSGTLIGPGQWVRVEDTGEPFRNMVTLANGNEINLENYGLVFREVFSWATMILALVWLLYWIVPKPTVTRLAITSQLSVNDDGGESVGLITKKDHRAMNLIMLATLLLLAVGWIYQASAYPLKIPVQVDRYRMPSAPFPPSIVDGTVATNAVLDQAAGTVTFTFQATNQSSTPVRIESLHLGDVTMLAANETGLSTFVTDGEIAPGQTGEITVTLDAGVLDEHLLLPRNSPNTTMGGVAKFVDGSGGANFETFQQQLRFDFANAPAG